MRKHSGVNNSLDKVYLDLIAMQLTDVSCKFVYWFPSRACKLTINYVNRRFDREGLSFLTKTLPRLGRCLDKALSGNSRLDASRWQKLPGSCLPRFLGEAFERVFYHDGWVRPDPCTDSVQTLRQILFWCGKLELPYEKQQERAAVNDFKIVDSSLPEPTSRISTERGDPTETCPVIWARSGGVITSSASASTTKESTCVPHGARVGSYGRQTPYFYDIVSGSEGQEHRRCVSADGGYQYPTRRTNGSCGDSRRSNRSVGCTCEICRGTGDELRSWLNFCACNTSNSRWLGREYFAIHRAGSGKHHCVATSSCNPARAARKEHREASVGLKTSTCSFSPTGCYSIGEIRDHSRTLEPELIGLDKVGIRGLSFNLGKDLLIRRARRLLHNLLTTYDPYDITPRHGPGAVATGEQNWEKMSFSRYYTRLHEHYPFDAYFQASPTHTCDDIPKLQRLLELEHGTAKVCLVPKDSRGPRIISMEPLEFQWIQQGIMRSLIRHIESNALTQGIVNFTDQNINRELAKQASIDGQMATLDLKEASDRVSLALVRELFPEHFVKALEAVRSTSTELPSDTGEPEILHLKKWAPMGSALCFPILSLVAWSISSSVLLSKYNIRDPKRIRGAVYVYGDDVITQTADAADVIAGLEYVGLKVNRDKSFATGFFRESCGMDAFHGVEVSPQRVKTPWSSRRHSAHLDAWIDYSNRFYAKGYYATAEHIANLLDAQYGPLPHDESDTGKPYTVFKHSLGPVRRPKTKFNKHLQRLMEFVWVSKPKKIRSSTISWSDVLRYYVYHPGETGVVFKRRYGPERVSVDVCIVEGVRAGVYVNPKVSMLTRGWR